MKVRLPHFKHPILAAALIAGGGYWVASAYQEHQAEQTAKLAEVLDTRGLAALGGQAINLQGLETEAITRPPKPFSKKQPWPRLGEADVLGARDTLLSEAGRTKADSRELVMASCVLAAVNAPNHEDVAPALALANRHYTEGAIEVAATDCTDYLTHLVSQKQDNFVTITGVPTA